MNQQMNRQNENNQNMINQMRDEINRNYIENNKKLFDSIINQTDKLIKALLEKNKGNINQNLRKDLEHLLEEQKKMLKNFNNDNDDTETNYSDIPSRRKKRN